MWCVRNPSHRSLGNDALHCSESEVIPTECSAGGWLLADLGK